MPPRARKTTTKPSQSDGNPTDADVSAALDVIETPDSELDELAVVDDADNPIPTELQFSTTRPAAEAAKPKTEATLLTVDGYELVAFQPKPAAWNLLLGSMSRSANAADKSFAMWDIVRNTFDEASMMYIQDRLMAPDDEFDDEILSNIIVALIKQWTPNLNRAQRRAAAQQRR
ncbi:hypothetical protein [Rhodococcus erythropolis]|uniref:hypothetical protein n=1 Tax=Rhodococcus erythropolis TaxID=1833 RepID=UPI00366F789E